MQGADNKNYAPPKAAVADVQPEDVLNKPPAVFGALILLWIFTGMTAAGSLLLLFQKKPAESVSSLIVFVLIALLTVSIGRRSRAARGVFLVLAVVMLLGGGITVTQIAQTHGRQPIGRIAATVLLVLSAGILFTPRANAWFNRRP
jgi:FtsH-binding integral membrane protein